MFEHLSDNEIRALVERPQIQEFTTAATLEAAHQRARWGNEHDDSKTPEDWFWVLGYLSGKALAAYNAGDIEKAQHHTISSAAVLAHWHEHMSLKETSESEGKSDG